MSDPTATLAVSSPGRSTGGVAGSRDSGTTTNTAPAATRAVGTNATNTLGQVNSLSSSPPTTGPTATPSSATAPHAPMAPARSLRSGKALVITDSVVGKINAANAPITNRTAINWPGLPHNAP